jgi:hypothetical protein
MIKARLPFFSRALIITFIRKTRRLGPRRGSDDLTRALALPPGLLTLTPIGE